MDSNRWIHCPWIIIRIEMGLLGLVLFHWKPVLEKIFPAVLEDQMVFFEIFGENIFDSFCGYSREYWGIVLLK